MVNGWTFCSLFDCWTISLRLWLKLWNFGSYQGNMRFKNATVVADDEDDNCEISLTLRHDLQYNASQHG